MGALLSLSFPHPAICLTADPELGLSAVGDHLFGAASSAHSHRELTGLMRVMQILEVRGGLVCVVWGGCGVGCVGSSARQGRWATRVLLLLSSVSISAHAECSLVGSVRRRRGWWATRVQLLCIRSAHGLHRVLDKGSVFSGSHSSLEASWGSAQQQAHQLTCRAGSRGGMTGTVCVCVSLCARLLFLRKSRRKHWQNMDLFESRSSPPHMIAQSTTRDMSAT